MNTNNKKTWTKFQLFMQLGLSYLFLVSVGLAAIASASFNYSLSRFDQSFHYFSQQLIAFILCGVMIVLITFIKLPKKYSRMRNYKFLESDKVLVVIYLISIVLLILVPIIGEERNGAKRWIFGMQPSEFIKISYILYAAKLMSKLDKEDTNNLFSLVKKYWPNFVFLAMLPALIILQSDLGTIIHYAWIFISMIVLSKFRFRDIFGTAAIVFSSAIPFALTEGYRMKRIGEWWDGVKINGIGGGYQVEQSVIGMGNGGLLGTGYGNGVQKYQWLPEIHTDFIFASIGEEWGFLACCLILFAFILMFTSGITMAIKIKDSFPKYVTIGIISYIVAQAIMNLYVITGIVPVKGIPLPFISYGRSSLISLSICIGLLFNILRFAELE